MSTPSGGPLNIPSQLQSAGPRQLNIYAPDGSVARTVTIGQQPVTIGQQRTDPGFFKNVVTRIRTHNQPIRAGLVVAGFGLGGTALLSAAVLNLGNPALFVFRRDDWKEMLSHLKGSAWDVWLSYFSDVAPQWKGHAVETFQQYLRFKLIGMFDQLGAITKDMSGTMHGQYKEVLEYDMSLVAMWAAASPVFKMLLPASNTPLGRVALMTHAGVFLTAVGTLLKQFADVYNKYEGDLNDIELKITDLKGAFYNMGNRSMGARDLHVDADIIGDLRNWKPATEEGS
ncbi:hypothetical protein [Microtetraspora sp. AC03309]|uniref:hypothetical protein n=1 Tax=Microtetraspora sp. AC03309 TaxID=2779376 RepID=UPI001E3A54C1|nr:hypothetical protein [Microtetraspora sp. AC03309]